MDMQAWERTLRPMQGKTLAAREIEEALQEIKVRTQLRMCELFQGAPDADDDAADDADDDAADDADDDAADDEV